MISHFKTSFTVTIFFVVFLLPVLALAQEVQNYIPIVTIPGVNDNQNTDTDFGSYINALYIFAITAGALLAVLKLVGAGVKYMFSDIVTNKMEAIRDIKGALLGLLLIIGAVIILNTINTDLTRIDFTVGTLDDLPNAPPIDPRIIQVSELCDETPGCQRLTGLTEEQCSAIGGYYINYIIYRDECIVIPPDSCQPPNNYRCTETSCECYVPRDTTCDEGETLVCDDRYRCQCVNNNTTQNIFPGEEVPHTEIQTRANSLIDSGYRAIPNGNSQPFQNTPSELQEKVSNCMTQGGDSYFLSRYPEDIGVRLICFASP